MNVFRSAHPVRRENLFRHPVDGKRQRIQQVHFPGIESLLDEGAIGDTSDEHIVGLAQFEESVPLGR